MQKRIKIPRGSRWHVAFGATAVSLALMIGGCSAATGQTDAASEETYTIRLADYLPASHFIATDFVVPWQEEVESLTDGRVVFEYYPGEQLVGSAELYSAMKGGIIDAALFVPTVAARSELPMTSVAALPGVELPQTQGGTTLAYNELVTGVLAEEEYEGEGIHPIAGLTAGQYQLINRGGPVSSASDWSGQIIRGAGGMLDVMIDHLGGASAAIPTTEVYEALQRKTIDSAIAAGESVPQYDWEDVAGSVSTNAHLGAGGVVLGITEEKWAELPPDVQMAIEEATDNVVKSYAESTTKLTSSIIEDLQDHVEYYELSTADHDGLQPAALKAQEAWLAQQAKGGRDGQKVLDAWRAAAEKHGSAFVE